MGRRSKYYFLLAFLLLAYQVTNAQDKGIIQVGRPKLWPFAEARTFIHSSRESLNALRITGPQSNDLNPNEINIRELDTLKTSLSILAEFDQSSFLKGREDVRNYNEKHQQWEERSFRAEQIDAELRSLNAQKATALAEQARLQSRKQTNDQRIQEIQAKLASAQPSTGSGGTASNATEGTGSTTPGASPANPALTDEEKNELRKERDRRLMDRLNYDERLPDVAADIARLDARVTARTQEKTSLGDLTPPQFPSLQNGSTPAGQTTQSNQGSQNVSPAGVSNASNSDAIQQAIAQRIGDIVRGDPKQTLFQILENLTDGELQLLSRKLTLGKGSSDPYYQLYFMELSSTVLPGPENRGQIARVRWKIAPCTAAESGRSVIQATAAKDVRTPFIYELTPIRSQVLTAASAFRQADRNINAKAGFWGGVFGIGRSRQQTNTHQTLERDVLIAGAGKGLPEFGWDIMPFSEEEFVTAGGYTAFAILAVPEACGNFLQISRNDGWLDLKTRVREVGKRDSTAANVFRSDEWKPFESYESSRGGVPATNIRASIVDLPLLKESDTEIVAISDISYVSAAPGGVATVTLRGPLFSEETKVLVGGTPLQSREIPNANTATVQNGAPPTSTQQFPGEFEVPSSKLLIMRFQCPANYVGTPSIVVYSPSFTALDLKPIPVNNKTAAGRDTQKRKTNEKGEFITSFDWLEQAYQAGAPIGDVLCPGPKADAPTVLVSATNRRSGRPLIEPAIQTEVVDANVVIQGISDQFAYETQVILNPAGREECQWSCMGGACIRYPDAQFVFGDVLRSHTDARGRREGLYSILPVTPTGNRRFAARIKIERVPVSCGLDVLVRSPDVGGITLGADSKTLLPKPEIVDVDKLVATRDGNKISIPLRGLHLNSIGDVTSTGLSEATIASRSDESLVLNAILKNDSRTKQEISVLVRIGRTIAVTLLNL